MTKRFMFLSGLPRSGSTLLSSILNQNPSVYSGPNSPMCGMMFHLNNSLIASEQWRAYPKPQVLQGVTYGVLENFYADIDRPYVIDKSREWTVPPCFEVLKQNLPNQPKVVVLVRPIIEILASFINLVHLNAGSASFIDIEVEALNQFNFYRPPDDIRCDSLMRPKGPIDNSLFGIAYACQPENRQFFHFVEYDDLVANPRETINKIYDFLNIEPYEHDYKNIVNIAHEDDTVFGLNGMHDVRKELSRSKIDPRSILSDYAIQKYSNMEFWRNAARS